MNIKSNAEYLKDKYPKQEIYKYIDEFDNSIEYWSIINGEGVKFNWDCMTWARSCLTAFWVTDTCIKL